MSEPQQVHSALLAMDAAGAVRILATDSALIAFEFEHYGTDADEIGVVSAKDVGPGLWLWHGTVTAVDRRGYEDLYPEWVPEFKGALLNVLDPAEMVDVVSLAELFAMSPPEPEHPDDDRDSADQ